MTNINSTSVPLPTDPLGSAIVAILSVIGAIVLAIGLGYICVKGIEQIKGHFKRLERIEKRIKWLEQSSVSAETKTGE